MATALQQQLVAIAANSTHQLDLRAQKGRHSKSLLFEPRDAASQSFDTIYQICYEGFEELCMLDARFSPFSRNLFSEQSKYEDRTQMTTKENEELDRTLESFLGLVCARLLLKPAMKAVEWLVRRFRVQEYNTQNVLLTFLPYHTSHIFPTLLSILPSQLPPNFRFLHPYVASLQSPPRHAILSAAISTTGFFSAFSEYVIAVAKARHQSALLVGFWASITAQAVNGMINASRSGRDSVRKQREEDILLRVLPVLQSALSIRGVPELFLGASMVLTIIASKMSPEDTVLDAMMEAIAGAWSEGTIAEGIHCLAILAEEKQQPTLPPVVFRAMLRCNDVMAQIARLGQVQSINNLATGCALGSITRACRSDSVEDIRLATGLLDANALREEHTVHVLQALINGLPQLRQSDSNGALCAEISSFLTKFAEDQNHMRLCEQAAYRADIDLRSLDFPLMQSLSDDDPEPVLVDQMEVDDPPQLDTNVELTSLMRDLPPLQGKSLLDPALNDTFYQYKTAFQQVQASEKQTRRFLSISTLHGSQPIASVVFMTFLARIWSSNATIAAKVQAIQSATASLSSSDAEEGANMQAILPYLITALADSSQKVRVAATKLCLAAEKHLRSKKSNWAGGVIYGQRSADVEWMAAESSNKFFSSSILPKLEDCIVDGSHIVRSLADSLDKDLEGIKKAIRLAACTFLASHARVTPVLQVRLVLLRILNSVGKSSGSIRVKVLLPLLREWSELTTEEASRVCTNEGVDRHELSIFMVAAMSQRSSEEVRALQDLAVAHHGTREELSALAYERLRHIWTKLKSTLQIQIVDWLLELTLRYPDDVASTEHAHETLRALQLPAEVFIHILDGLPNATDLQDQPPSAKKQRTSRTESSQPRQVDSAKLQAAIVRITTVLELVESAKPGSHPQLLKALFSVLSELHHYKTLTGSDLVYLQQILLSCLLAVVNGLLTTKDVDVDRSVVRTDLIVECVRSTASTQVHNTALLLVSSLASWAPELVLHSVMPLFTFMSSTLLRQSDEYSAHVADQTVARIVPALAASLKTKGKDLVSGASELLLSFTAAFEHIPLHRRAGLFEHLVTTLGPNETLFAVLAMLAERYPSDSRVPAFAADLTNFFATSTALLASVQYIDLIFDALKSNRGLSNILLGLNDKTEGETEDAVDNLLEQLTKLLQNSRLRQRLARELEKESEASKDLRSTYASLLEKSMQLARDLATNDGLKDSADALLLSVLGLMPTKDFIESSAQLMQTGTDETRQQVFHSLEARVAQARRVDTSSQLVFINVLPSCGAFIRADQPIATRHAAMSCIDQISEKYGKTDRETVLDVAKQVAGEAALASDDLSLRVIAILCLASMVEVLGDDCIAILPDILARALGYLQTDAVDVSLCNATFGLVNAVLDHLPWMLSAGYLDQALALAARTATLTQGGQSAAIEDFQTLAARKTSASELFTAIERTWTDVCSIGEDAIAFHLTTLHQAVQHHNKATVTKNAQTLFAVVLDAFDLRQGVHDDGESIEDHNDMYALVNNVALDMTMKMNDATFRPFFIRLVEWATNALPKKELEDRALRKMSLYSFALTLFEQLKSIVTSYAGFLLDSAAEVLQEPYTGESYHKSLSDLVLQALSSNFRNDQVDFWQAPAHFDAIAKPLVSQLKAAKLVQVTDHAIPAITDLAAAAASPEHLKAMNAMIMSCMRDENAAVRLAAVKCERSISERVNFDWLALLPEMLPLISELQEDDDESVERETLRWVKQIEDITGESLEGMLA